jgi:hypothetical protein
MSPRHALSERRGAIAPKRTIPKPTATGAAIFPHFSSNHVSEPALVSWEDSSLTNAPR